MKKKFVFITFFLFHISILYSEDNLYERFISSEVVVGEKKLPYYIVYDNNRPISFFIESKDWTDEDIKGYGGEINLQIYFSLDGKIINIKVIEQNETEAYAGNVFKENYLKQYFGKDNKSKFLLGEDIEAITGATITCNAVNEIIYQCVKNVYKYLLHEEVIKKYTRIPKKEIIKTLILAIIFSLASLGFILNNKFLRYLLMTFSMIFLGIFYNGGLSFGHIQNLFYLNIPIKANIFILTLIIFTLFTTILFGRLYCGWICPFGVVIEFLFNIKRFFEERYKRSLGKEIELEFVEDIRIIKILRKYEKYFRQLKYFLFILILVFPKLIFFEPFQKLFLFRKNQIIEIIYLVILLTFCILFIRLWCRYICPLGGFLALISKISIFKLKIEKDTCLNCEICKLKCPTNAIIEKQNLLILNSECILCNKCRQNCGPKNIKIKS